MRLSRLYVCVFLAALSAQAEQLYTLRGKLLPAVDYVTVAISGVKNPYQDRKQTAGSRFRFKDLPAGAYTLVIAHPKWGETRKTIAVSAASADRHGRVKVVVPLERTQAAKSRNLRERSVVSVRELRTPEKAIELRRKAQAELEKRDAESAIAYLHEAVEVDPDYADAWNDLGVLANQRRDFELAETYFRQALEAAPDDFPPLVNLGGVLLAQRKLEEALRVNSEALLARPRDALANAQLGLCYFHLEDEGKALMFLIRAKRLDPYHFTHPQAFLAEIHARNGRYETAIRELEDLANRYPGMETGERARKAAERLREKLGG